MEVAAYELLIRVGERVGDAPTVAVARVIRAQEQKMSERLAGRFDTAVDASLRDIAPGDLPEQVNKYLADAHALEAQAIELLSRSQKIGGDAQLQEIYREHLEESREHQRLLEERLAARGGRPAAFKDAALRLGAVNWGLFFKSQPDTPAKLAGFAYAFEHLEIAGYELLKRVAERAGDTETVDLAELIGEQERAAARRVAEGFDAAIEASLRDLGVSVGSR
jgi:ferritin-like metal-binding protein YciE